MSKRGHLLLVIAALSAAGSQADESPVLGRDAATFPLAPNESRTFAIHPAPGEYLRIAAQGDGATLNCVLRSAGARIAEVNSLGGTGGAAAIAAVFEAGGAMELQVRRTEKAGVAVPVRVEIVDRHAATPADIREAAAYRAFASAKSPAEFADVAGASAGALQLLAVSAEIRALFGAQRYQDGIELAERHLEAARALPSPRAEAQLLYLAGLCEILLERNDAAVGYFTRALPLQRSLNQPYELAATLHNLAAAHQVLSNCRDALQAAQEALAIRSTLADPPRQAISQLSVAKAHVCSGDAQAALDEYHAVIPQWQRLHDTRNEAASWNDVGVVLTSLGAFAEARDALASAQRLREAAHDDAGRAETLVNTGNLRLMQHDYKGALAGYEAALAIPEAGEYQRRIGYALEGKAEALFRLGQRAEVNELLHRSVATLQQVGDRLGEAFTWQMLGEAENSIEDLTRTATLAEAAGDRALQAVALTAAARMEFQAHDAAAARRDLQHALPLIEAARADLTNPQLRISFLATRRDAYELLVRLLTQEKGAGRDWQAFAVSERAHARALLDEMGAAPGVLGEVASLDEIRSQALDAHTVLVEYFLGEQQSWGWFVSSTAFQRFELPGRATLDGLVSRYRASLTARNVRNPGESPEGRALRLKNADAETERMARELSHTLLGPLEARSGDLRLLVVDDGSLRLAPFATLHRKGEVVMVPSASVLVQSRRTRAPETANTRMLLLADPVFSADDERVSTRSAAAASAQTYPRLTESRQEARDIAALLPARNVVEKLDFDASPEALRGAAGRDFGVIHIAAHTVLDSRRPELSGIVLSLVNRKGEAERGILRLRELYDLRLQTGLVTLSACETGIGKEAGGEGMLGISHAFLYAGARRVVASLWKVEDTATATMMQHFYRAIYQQHLTPAAALYAAQTAMRSDPRWAAPYYWASFVLEGEWR